MRGLMDKSLNFWKNDLKMSKIGSGCCCQRDILIEEPKIQGAIPEELPFYEPTKKGATIFKTIKKEDQRNPLTINESLENSGFKSISSHQENYLDNFENALDAVKYFKKIGANYSFNHKNLNENNYSNIRKFYKKNLLNYRENFKIDWNIYFFFCQKYV
jgi:hypothetical protein